VGMPRATDLHARPASRASGPESKRLKEAGVLFTKEPARHGPVMLAMFHDKCGSLIQMHQAV
jgi:hypothetical protein